MGTVSRNGEVVNQANCLVTGAGELACELYEATYTIVIRDDPILNGVPEPLVVIGGARGTLEAAPGQATGSGTLYAAPGRVLSDGSSVVADFTIVGGSLRDDRQHLDLIFDSLGEISTFSGTFDPYYNWDSSLAMMPERVGLVVASGVYTDFDLHGDPASLSIDPDGAFFSQSGTGCVFSGQVGVIDPAYNGFTVSGTLNSCSGLNGAYTGFAFMIDFAWVNDYDRLNVFVFNDDGFIAAQALKAF